MVVKLRRARKPIKRRRSKRLARKKQAGRGIQDFLAKTIWKHLKWRFNNR